MPELFAKSNLMGTFKGFAERGFEFAAEIVAPYEVSMVEKPQLGQFLLIELGDQEEASLGRITKFVPSGLLASAEGEDYLNTMQRRGHEVSVDIKNDKLKYKVQIKLLGAVKIIKEDSGKERIVFVPSQRRLPHLGAKVALPSMEVLKELCSLSEGKTDLGDYVLGEFVYSGASDDGRGIFRHLTPKLEVKFNVNNLVSKRSVVFARAGYGKSNLIKYLLSELYQGTGENAKTDKGQRLGTLIFDADGEYFWPDHRQRPGLCDVSHLRNQIVVFTSRPPRNPYYGSWKVGPVKLDIRDLPARDVVSIALPSDKQINQNVIKLKSLAPADWRKLVDLIHEKRLRADEKAVGDILGFTNESQGTAEIIAAKSNMLNIVNHLHDPNSNLITGCIQALSEGMIVVVDISLLSAGGGTNVAGLLMRRIFNHNQENFTTTRPTIPVNVVIEEAQGVLGKRLDETSPFVEWVKEGRKYDLGAILITQQPGSMAPEIMSQADNWFCFHLLSEGDVATLGKYNSHYSHDILAHLIGEPIQGNCYMWSAPKQPFVLPVRVRDFEHLYKDYVKTNESEKAISLALADKIRGIADESISEFAAALISMLKAKPGTLKAHDFENGLLGFYKNQLFVVFEDIKKNNLQNEIRTTDSLLVPVLRKAFNSEVQIKKANHGEKKDVDFYCFPKEKVHAALTL